VAQRNEYRWRTVITPGAGVEVTSFLAQDAAARTVRTDFDLTASPSVAATIRRFPVAARFFSWLIACLV
jgi:hypothetical protein